MQLEFTDLNTRGDGAVERKTEQERGREKLPSVQKELEMNRRKSQDLTQERVVVWFTAVRVERPPCTH